MNLYKLKSIIGVALIASMFGSCTKETAPAYNPPQLPDSNAPAIEWSGMFAGPQGERPRLSQASDMSTLYYATHMPGAGIYVGSSEDYGSIWSNRTFVVASSVDKDPSILALNGGEQVLAYTKHVNGAMGIGMAKGSDKGKIWFDRADIVIPTNVGQYIGQPHLVEVGSDIYCYFSQNTSTEKIQNHLMLTISSDKGDSWSTPQEVMGTDILGDDGFVNSISVVKNKNNELIAVFEGKDTRYFSSYSVLSSKSIDGITWSKPSNVFAYPGDSKSSYGAGDPSLAKLQDGRLITTYQYSDGGGKVSYSLSYDDGETWRSGEYLFIGQVGKGTMAYVTDNKFLFVGISGSKFDLAPMDPDAVRKLPFYIFPRHSSTISIDANWPWEGEAGFAGAQDNDMHMWDHEIRDGIMGGQSWKTFKLINNKDGYFLMQPISGVPTNKVVTLMVVEDELNRGELNNINLRDNIASDNQLWYIEETDSDYYKIINKENGYVMTVAGGEVRNDAQLIGAPDEGLDYQQWITASMNPDYDPFKTFLKENEDNGWGK